MQIQNSKFKIQNWQNGFTLIELMIIIGLMTITSVVLIPQFVGSREKKNLDLSAQTIVQNMRLAMERSRFQEGGNQWWLHFHNPTGLNNDYYTFCAGANYSGTPGANCAAEGGTEMSRVVIPSGIKFTDPADNSSKLMIFNKATGLPAASYQVTVYLNDSLQRTISIDTNGRISS